MDELFSEDGLKALLAKKAWAWDSLSGYVFALARRRWPFPRPWQPQGPALPFDGDDVAQVALLKLAGGALERLIAREGLDLGTALRYFVIAVVRDAGRYLWRRHTVEKRDYRRTTHVPWGFGDEERLPQIFDRAPGPERLDEAQEERNRLRETLERLHPGFGDAIDLLYFEGRKAREVADILGIHPHLVYTWVVRARRYLKDRLFVPFLPPLGGSIRPLKESSSTGRVVRVSTSSSY